MFKKILPSLYLGLTLATSAQSPRVLLRFNGNLSDSSSAGLVTAVTPSVGFTPTYTSDRNGAANGAIVFTGGQSLLLGSSLPGNSNQALGLRNSSGTNTSFTLSAWVMFTSLGSGQGYNTIFGNSGSGTGTLHAGANVNSDKTHFGFDSNNDANGGAASLVTGVWYHIAYTYDTTSSNAQRVYINGIPDVTRTNVTNTLKVADLMLGNWGDPTSSANDFKGRLDDVAIYNTALKGDQILALANRVSALSVPAAGTYFAPPSTGFRGTTGMWGIREIKDYPGINYNSIVNLDRILKDYETTPAGTKVDYWAPVINFTDDEEPGNLGYFTNEGDFATNTPAPDNNFLLFARCSIRIPTAGPYTFGFRGDDGSRLRVVGQPFISSTRLAGGDADPAHMSDTLIFPGTTGDSNTLGVVNLAAGEYDLEFSYWEGSGGSAIEVYSAPGSKTSVDSSFQLIGNTAAGGLEIVRDSDTVPSFTVNGGASLFVFGGSPTTATLAWTVNDSSTTLSINQGIGPVTQTGTLSIPVPAVTTSYLITATIGADVVTKEVIIYVDTKPVIPSFTSSTSTVAPNAPVTLNWNVQGAASLMLNPGNINVTGTSSIVVNPASTTTYTLTATNAQGSTPSSLTITTGAVPTIVFTVSNPSPPYGKETGLTWVVTGSTSQSIDQNIGSVPASGSTFVVPLISTTYTLTATNAFGTTSSSVATVIPTPLGVSSAGFFARRVSSTVPFPFSGQGYLQSALSLLGGQNAGTTTTGGPYTTINFADGADGDYPSGNSGFPGGSGDHFAVEVTGTLVVNTPGSYTFMVNSDDGCRLRIDGVDVIVDDATHSPSTSSGSITLTKPTATFQLIHYDVTGGANLEVSWVRPNLTWQQLSTVTPSTPTQRGGLVLSEFVASGSTLTDEDGTTQDWIEIWNSSNAAINLNGYFLTNASATPNLWAFPSKVLAPNEYLVVFASGKNRTNPALNLHTSFNLPGGGGYLALARSNGSGGFTTLTEFNPFPAQTNGQSYGNSTSGSLAVGYMEVPTPAAPNAAIFAGFIQPVTFSTQRGRFTAPFSLTLSTSSAGTSIRYTTDGSEPSWSRGSLYTGPFNVSSTSVIRANAFLNDWKSPEAVTNSYLFLDDVITQTTSNTIAKGWPQSSVNGQVYRYGMNLAAVTSAGGDATALKNSLAAAPSVMLNLNPDDFHGASQGINSNPGKRGRFWERDASLEIIEANGTVNVQKDCGVRIRGGASRSTSNPKHAFHLYFRSLYAGDLIYPIFGTEGSVTRFDQIDMRCEQNNSWSKDNSSNNALMREEIARITQRDMGQPYSRTDYFHLYINGIYWGIFNWQEKTEADYAANQFGGDDSDYDTVKSAGSSGSYDTEMTDGNELAWRQLFDLCISLRNATTDASRNAIYFQMQGLSPNGIRNTSFPILLTPNNLIDAQIAMFWTGSFDGPMSTFVGASNNWFAIRKRDGSLGGFMFFLHDHEHSMGTQNNSYNRVGPWGNPNVSTNNWGQTQVGNSTTWKKFNPQYLHEFLCFSTEYRQRFSDRARKHLLGNGALSLAASLARADSLSVEIDPIIHAEAARWGSTSLNKNTWLNTGRAGVYNFINTSGSKPSGQTSWPNQARNLTVIEQLKGYTDVGAKPLFINVNDPVVSGIAGGLVNSPYAFTITNPSAGGTIYYTLDGNDPRSIGGGIYSNALTGGSPINVVINASATLNARIFNSTTNEWSGLIENTYLVAVPATAANTVISKIHYRPASGVTTGEFLEIMNIGSQSISLTNCRFTVGITYTFPTNFILPAGARCVIVENQTAFTAAFPTVNVAGQYSGGLSNSGERLTFIDNLGTVIKDFSYGIASPWPSDPNGTGPSLVLLRPETNPAHGTGANWRASTTNGGSPGLAEAGRIGPWFTANGITDLTGLGDKDSDGLADLLEYALGTNPSAHNPDGLTTGSINLMGQDYLSVTLVRPLGRDDVTYQGESGTLLNTWLNAVQLSSTPNYTNSTETTVWRHPTPKQNSGQQFIRLKVTRQ